MITRESRVHQSRFGSITISREQKDDEVPKYSLSAEGQYQIIKISSGGIEETRAFIQGLLESVDKVGPKAL